MTGKSRIVIIALGSAMVGASLLQGTGPTMIGDPYVDSAAVARAAYARASAALRANDRRTAKAEAARAANAWPTQPTYQGARVVVAMRMRDTATVLDALTRYADLGLGRDLTVDTALASLVQHPPFAAVAARHAAQFAPLLRGRATAVLPDSTFFPEGMDVDPRSGLTYVASIRHRTIAELTPTRVKNGANVPLFRSLQGIAPVPDGRTVIVADYSHGLLKVDALTGEVTRIADGPGMTSLGCDGLSWHDGAVVAVQNGVFPPRIVRFELDSAWTKITRAVVLDQNLPVADEPTIGTIVGDDFIYVANSQWEKYGADGALLPRAVLKRPVLLRVPLDPGIGNRE